MFPALYCYWLKGMLKKYWVEQKQIMLLLPVQRNAEEVNQIVSTLVIKIVLYPSNYLKGLTSHYTFYKS